MPLATLVFYGSYRRDRVGIRLARYVLARYVLAGLTARGHAEQRLATSLCLEAKPRSHHSLGNLALAYERTT